MRAVLLLHGSGAAKLLVVAGGLPSALGDGLGDLVVNVGSGLAEVVEGELVKGSGSLNVGESGLELGELLLDGGGGLLGVGDGLGLESLNGLELLGDVVGDWGERLIRSLDLVDNGLVLEGLAVEGEVDVGGLGAELVDGLDGVVVALAEALEAGDGAAGEAEGGDDLGPVNLNSALEEEGQLRVGNCVVLERYLE